MNWDYKLEPDIHERAEHVYERVQDMKDDEVVDLMRRLGKIKTDDFGQEIVPKDLTDMRNYLIDYLYWDDEYGI